MNIEELKGSNILKSAYSVSKKLGTPIFLVGGAVRDLILSCKFERDYDFVLSGSVLKATRLFAGMVKGSFFCLDSQRGHYRAVFREKTRDETADFSGFRGHMIDEDLKERDFTINSMAIDLTDIFEKGEIDIVDPLNGLNDIKKGIIRVCSSRAFDDDPLRLLRAIRFSAIPSFGIDVDTEGLIKQKKELLSDSSRERIRDELFLVLRTPRACESIKKLDRLGLLSVVLPEVSSWKYTNQGEHHDYDLFDHAVKTVEYTEKILCNFSDYFPDYTLSLKAHFDEELESNVTRGNLLKLIAFLHDSGKPETRRYDGGKVRFFGHDRTGEGINKAIAERLKLGHKAGRIIANLTKNHMRVLNLSGSENVTYRAKYRFFRDLDRDGLDCLLLSLADGLATRMHTVCETVTPLLSLLQDFLRYYFEDWLKAPKRPLLDGKEVMGLLGIPEGREVGRLLSLIREAELEGTISTKEEAEGFVKSLELHQL